MKMFGLFEKKRDVAMTVYILSLMNTYLEQCKGDIVLVKDEPGLTNELKKLGFEVLSSRANFLFARHEALSGSETYQNLRKRGILVRHFSKPRLDDFNRITIGTIEQMQALVNAMQQELEAAE